MWKIYCGGRHEYLSDHFKQLCEKKGVARHLRFFTHPNKWCYGENKTTLLDMVRSMMDPANLR